jgi:hypothetical protein
MPTGPMPEHALMLQVVDCWEIRLIEPAPSHRVKAPHVISA